MDRLGRLLAFGVAGLAIAGAAALAVPRLSHNDPTPAPDEADSKLTATAANATIAYVVDGDTVDVRIGAHEERVRLIGVDTPETVARDRPVECYGPEAHDYTATLLPVGTAVRLVRDIEPRDDYGRLLGYVYRASDGLFVNLELAWQGLARPLTIRPNDAHATEIVGAAAAAERADRGLWRACAG
jgi:micrococcal nuclease